MRTTDRKLGTIKMGWRVAAGVGIWCVVSAVSAVASAQALAIKPDALLSIDLNRETVVEKITASWAKEIPAAQIESFKAKLAGLRADQLLAANLAGSFDGVLEVLSEADDTRQSAYSKSPDHHRRNRAAARRSKFTRFCAAPYAAPYAATSAATDAVATPSARQIKSRWRSHH